MLEAAPLPLDVSELLVQIVEVSLQKVVLRLG